LVGIFGIGKETYLYINGLIVSEEIQLNKNKFLMPVLCKLPLNTISKSVKSDIDFAIFILCSGAINSQLKIISDNSEKLAISAWNSQWDLILLSAIFKCEAMINIQCTHPVEAIEEDAILQVTNYYMHGFFNKPYTITKEDTIWLNNYFSNGQSLLSNDFFCNAIHSMATFRWHSMPRVQLAILWAGIEGLFRIHGEITFKISLFISNFLAGSDKEKAKVMFNETKSLYNARSKAVHGDKIKGELSDLVEKSASLLNKIIIKCIMINGIPNEQDLIF